jgi:hypothetical protein
MHEVHRMPSVPNLGSGEGKAPELPVRLVPFHGDVPEKLAAFFERLTPWTWRDLRTVFCRHPETRRLVNIIRTIDLILEKAPHTLARGHWSIAGYREALDKLGSAISRLGHIAGVVAGDARVRLPVVPDRRPAPPEPMAHHRSTVPARPAGVFQKHVGGMKTSTSRPQAA